MKKRIFPVILSCVLIVPMMFSCADKDTAKNSDATTQPQSQTAEVTTEGRLYPDLPEKDFEGYNFRILTKGQFDVHWKSKDIYAEEQTGEVINDAVYQRNAAMMEKYNFTITEVPAQDTAATAKKSILAQSDDFDMLCMGIPAAGSLMSSGYILNLNDVPYMDLSKPWYDQNANKQLSIMNKLYMTVGELTIMDNDATWVVLFNKQIARDLGLPDFYQAVHSGEWTIDMMWDSAKKAAKDLNGDSVMDETDQWGMESESFNTFALCIGAGANVVSKDENDIPYFTMNTERFVNAFGKAMPMQTDYNTTMYVTKFNSKFPGVSVWSDCMDKTFADGRSLFNFAGLNRVTLFRSMETDFGILPVPKYDKEQEKYYNVVSQWCSNSIAIPITVTDIERTGIIIEALSAESMYTLTPAYYDIALTTKSARDEESVAMLDLIFNNRVYDLANTYDWGGALSLITSMTDSAKTDLASGLESKTPAFEKALAKFLDDVALLQ
ncbi:MAG: hypothetical protein AB9835_01250 [Eubacteriales bacterium]